MLGKLVRCGENECARRGVVVRLTTASWCNPLCNPIQSLIQRKKLLQCSFLCPSRPCVASSVQKGGREGVLIQKKKKEGKVEEGRVIVTKQTINVIMMLTNVQLACIQGCGHASILPYKHLPVLSLLAIARQKKQIEHCPPSDTVVKEHIWKASCSYDLSPDLQSGLSSAALKASRSSGPRA